MKKALLINSFLCIILLSFTTFVALHGDAFTDFFTKSIPSGFSSAGNWIKGAAESTGDWFKGAANTVYKGAILPTYEKALVPFYEKALIPTYEQVLKPAYEKGIRVALNWVGNEVIIPTLIKVIIPGFKWLTNAYNYLNDKGLHYVTGGLQDGLNYVLEKTHTDVVFDKINNAAEWVGDKVSSTVLYPIIEPIRLLKEEVEKEIPVIESAATYVMGAQLYTTDISGKKTLAVDAHGNPIADPANPALTDRIINAINPVYSIVDKLGGTDKQNGTHVTGFIEVVGNIIVTIHETRTQIQALQQDLLQPIADMPDTEKKVFQDALKQLDNDLKSLADTVSLQEEKKEGYLLIRTADPNRNEQSIFCKPQGGTVCDITNKGVNAKLSFDADLTKLNKLLEQLGNDINAGSSTCGLCKLADIGDKECTYPMRLQMSADILKQIVSNVFNNILQGIGKLSITAIAHLLTSSGLSKLLPPGISDSVDYVSNADDQDKM